MNYDRFKELWTSAFRDADLVEPFDEASLANETIILNQMTRCYSMFIGHFIPQPADPFFVSGMLSWKWDALQSARTATSEEAVLIELHGNRESAEIETEHPWLRVDIKLMAKLPMDSPQPIPSAPTMQKWTELVVENVVPHFPSEQFEFSSGSSVLGWCDEPTVESKCGPDGQLLLIGVEMEAWQPIILPRCWENADHEPQTDPRRQLTVLAKRIRGAITQWTECTKTLQNMDGSMNINHHNDDCSTIH